MGAGRGVAVTLQTNSDAPMPSGGSGRHFCLCLCDRNRIGTCADAATTFAANGTGTSRISSVQGERTPSVVVRERVVVGEPLPPTVELRPVPNHTEYRYAAVNDRRVLVEPRTRKVIKIIVRAA